MNLLLISSSSQFIQLSYTVSLSINNLFFFFCLRSNLKRKKFGWLNDDFYFFFILKAAFEMYYSYSFKFLFLNFKRRPPETPDSLSLSSSWSCCCWLMMMMIGMGWKNGLLEMTGMERQNQLSTEKGKPTLKASSSHFPFLYHSRYYSHSTSAQSHPFLFFYNFFIFFVRLFFFLLKHLIPSWCFIPCWSSFKISSLFFFYFAFIFHFDLMNFYKIKEKKKKEELSAISLLLHLSSSKGTNTHKLSFHYHVLLINQIFIIRPND